MTESLFDTPRPPRLDSLGLDPRLMTPARLLELAGSWQLEIGGTEDFTSLDCRECGKKVEELVDTRKDIPGYWPVTPMQILAATLRHRVMDHGLSLSGGDDGATGGEQQPGRGPAAGGDRGDRRVGGAGRDGHRLPGQAADPGREQGPAGGDH